MGLSLGVRLPERNCPCPAHFGLGKVLLQVEPELPSNQGRKKKKNTSSDNKHHAWAAGAISDTPVTHRVLLQALPLPLPSTDSSEFVFSTIIFSQLNNV